MRVVMAVALTMAGWAAGCAQLAGPVPKVSQEEIIAVQKHVQKFWNPPAVGKGPPVSIVLKLKPDGTLEEPPRVITQGSSAEFAAWRDAAVKAVYRAAPYTMLKPETYQVWKEIELVLDPRSQPARP